MSRLFPRLSCSRRYTNAARRHLAATALAIALTPGALLLAQDASIGPAAIAAAPREDRFATATITPSRAVGSTRISMPAGGRFEATNASIRSLIRFAYQVQDFQIVGGPGWIGSERFDVVADRPGELAPQLDGAPALRTRVRHLLADRFGLRIERETQVRPIYELVMVRADRTFGPGLRASSLNCAALAGEYARARQTAITPPSPALMRCGIRMSPGTLTAGGVTAASLARALSQLTGRSVEDRTGLTGYFDIQLNFFHELAPPADAPATERAAESGPSLFTALQDQLGLRLDSKRGPVDLLRIAKVARPTAD